PVRHARVTCGRPDVTGHTTISDDRGRFVFSGLPAGPYTVAAARGGWISTNYGATRPMRPGTAIPLADGGRASIVLRMPRGAAITGVVLDHNNQPASGAQVRALHYSMTNGEKRLVSDVEAATDDRGVYRIFGLAAGDYLVNATSREASSLPQIETRLTSEADVRDAAAPTPGPPPRARTVAIT